MKPETVEWVEKSEGDWNAARQLNRVRKDPNYDGVCFHCQQCAEKYLKAKLVDQICQVSGGPCEYKGADMKAAHSNMDITKTNFNALVEVLQKSMDAQGIAFSSQNQLLAKLAPMHRDVITVK